MPRPREHEDNAAKQRAYRARKRQVKKPKSLTFLERVERRDKELDEFFGRDNPPRS